MYNSSSSKRNICKETKENTSCYGCSSPEHVLPFHGNSFKLNVATLDKPAAFYDWQYGRQVLRRIFGPKRGEV
jgi:hypothetical protein